MSDNIKIQIGTLAELGAIVMPLRLGVFRDEQGIPQKAIDDWYNESETTCAVFKNDTLVATSRLTEINGVTTLGQVATLKSERGKGYGKIAVNALFELARKRKIKEIIVHAQKQAYGFYGKLGFVPIGEPYYEGEFELADMKINLKYKEKPTMILNTIEAIHTRYSCRAFADKIPPNEDLDIIAKAAACAPSGMNRQLWRVIVVKNRELIADLETEGMKNLTALPDKSIYDRIMSRGGKLYYNAPCMIVVPIAKAESAGSELLDCGIVTENIALSAASLGIDSLICGLAAFSFAGEKSAEFKKRLNFPDGYDIGIAVLLGYAEKPDGKPHEPDFSKIIWIE